MTPWTAAQQAPLVTGFSRQEYWSGLPLPSHNVLLELSKINRKTESPGNWEKIISELSCYNRMISNVLKK